MKKLKNMSESSFLKLLFGFMGVCFLIAAVCMPDRGEMFSGLGRILTMPSKISANYFAMGGYSATFLNMGLVCLLCLGLFVVFKGKPNNVSTLAVLLTLGFCSWGINILNMWFSVLGVVLYGLFKKQKLGTLVNAMLFSTGIAPLITELLVRYPQSGPEWIGFNPLGFILAVAVGIIIGVFLPAGLANSPKVHKGFDLYSAALPIGMTAFFLNATLYKTMGLSLPAQLAEGNSMAVASQSTVNIFCIAVFGICVVVALLMGCTPKKYWKLLSDPELVTNFSSTYGNEVFLMNLGVYGLFILGYYNLVGANFNGILFGIIFCMVATCNSGSHPGNVWPIMLGYVAASFLFGWISPMLGGEFTGKINAQAICVGLCYANGLSPIADKYGWGYAVVAAMMHFCMVTTVPDLHGAMCLYNGGFTAALVCLLMVPGLERHFKTKQERHALKAK